MKTLITEEKKVNHFNYTYIWNDLNIDKSLLEAEKDFKNWNILDIDNFLKKSLKFKNNLFVNV
jgi:hypothetical protein